MISQSQINQKRVSKTSIPETAFGIALKELIKF